MKRRLLLTAAFLGWSFAMTANAQPRPIARPPARAAAALAPAPAGVLITPDQRRCLESGGSWRATGSAPHCVCPRGMVNALELLDCPPDRKYDHCVHLEGSPSLPPAPPAPAAASPRPQCSDEADNDRDGRVDLADPGCNNDPEGTNEGADRQRPPAERRDSPRPERGESGAPGLPGGPSGLSGIHCWDLDADRQDDPEEDVTGDGVWDANDCQGSGGPQGPPGPAGERGPVGEADEAASCAATCEGTGGVWLTSDGAPRCVCDENFVLARNSCGCVARASESWADNLHLGAEIGWVSILRGERTAPGILNVAAVLSFDIADGDVELVAMGGPSFAGVEDRPIGGFGAAELRWWFSRRFGLAGGGHVHTVATDARGENEMIELGAQAGLEFRLRTKHGELRAGVRGLLGGQITHEPSDAVSLGAGAALGWRF